MTVLTRGVARFLLPASIMVALAVLVKGYADSGDGFSAGIIASLGVLVQYVAYGRSLPARLLVVRKASIISMMGLLVALLTNFVPVLLGDPVLTHRPKAGDHVTHIGAIELITPVLFDIGVFLLVLGFVVGTIDLIAQAIDRGRP